MRRQEDNGENNGPFMHYDHYSDLKTRRTPSTVNATLRTVRVWSMFRPHDHPTEVSSSPQCLSLPRQHPFQHSHRVCNLVFYGLIKKGWESIGENYKYSCYNTDMHNGCHITQLKLQLVPCIMFATSLSWNCSYTVHNGCHFTHLKLQLIQCIIYHWFISLTAKLASTQK